MLRVEGAAAAPADVAIEAPARDPPKLGPALRWLLVISLFAAVALVLILSARIFYPTEIDYSEGWNVYNAIRALAHNLYPVRHSWTTVNYPFLTFSLIGHLARFGWGLLLWGRLLALVGFLASSLLAGLITVVLTRRPWTGVLAFALAAATAAVLTPRYVGGDNPQMLGQACALLAVYLYLRCPATGRVLPLVALLFTLAMNCKPSLVAAPLAVFLDLCGCHRRRAAHFACYGIAMGAAAIEMNVALGGRYFLAQLLAPRLYDWSRLGAPTSHVYAFAILPAACVALCPHLWRHPPHRFVLGYLTIALFAGLCFSGAIGVGRNAFLDFFFATAMIVATAAISWQRRWTVVALALPLLLAAPALINAASGGRRWSPERNPARALRYENEVAFLRGRPGPALCESLLRCYDAGKPYVYDPFNSTALIRQGKLDAADLLRQIQNHAFSAIQTGAPVDRMPRPSERFTDATLDAIARNYRLALLDPDCAIYVPR